MSQSAIDSGGASARRRRTQVRTDQVLVFFGMLQDLSSSGSGAASRFADSSY